MKSTSSSEVPTHKNRRSFLNILLNSSLVGFLLSVLYPIWRYLTPPKGPGEATPASVMAGTVNDLKPNSGKIVKFGRKPVILIRTDAGEFRAFSAICTHLECIVQYRPDLKHIWCACHNGHYNLKGINISGPPPKPLEPYKVNIKEDKIYISREA
ncbi:MAG: plastoquinol--plastocyanin reductase [Calditrichaeota bacterium]|nr:MAG: plastoquinol--plastocyanin reductase [Calditrichota bacterium]